MPEPRVLGPSPSPEFGAPSLQPAPHPERTAALPAYLCRLVAAPDGSSSMLHYQPKGEREPDTAYRKRSDAADSSGFFRDALSTDAGMLSRGSWITFPASLSAVLTEVGGRSTNLCAFLAAAELLLLRDGAGLVLMLPLSTTGQVRDTARSTSTFGRVDQQVLQELPAAKEQVGQGRSGDPGFDDKVSAAVGQGDADLHELQADVGRHHGGASAGQWAGWLHGGILQSSQRLELEIEPDPYERIEELSIRSGRSVPEIIQALISCSFPMDPAETVLREAIS